MKRNIRWSGVVLLSGLLMTSASIMAMDNESKEKSSGDIKEEIRVKSMQFYDFCTEGCNIIWNQKTDKFASCVQRCSVETIKLSIILEELKQLQQKKN